MFFEQVWIVIRNSFDSYCLKNYLHFAQETYKPLKQAANRLVLLRPCGHEFNHVAPPMDFFINSDLLIPVARKFDDFDDIVRLLLHEEDRLLGQAGGEDGRSGKISHAMSHLDGLLSRHVAGVPGIGKKYTLKSNVTLLVINFTQTTLNPE